MRYVLEHNARDRGYGERPGDRDSDETAPGSLFANTVPGSADTGVGRTGVRLCVPDDVDWNLPPLQIPIEKIRPAELTPGGPAT